MKNYQVSGYLREHDQLLLIKCYFKAKKQCERDPFISLLITKLIKNLISKISYLIRYLTDSTTTKFLIFHLFKNFTLLHESFKLFRIYY